MKNSKRGSRELGGGIDRERASEGVGEMGRKCREREGTRKQEVKEGSVRKGE